MQIIDGNLLAQTIKAELKEKVDKVEKGEECGILLDKKLDFKINDSIIAYKIKSLL